MYDFNYNDIVMYKGKEFLTIKPNPKKFKAVELNSGQTWNFPYFMVTFVRKATAEDKDKLNDAQHLSEQKSAEAVKAGQIVRCTIPKLKGLLWVVTAINKTTDSIVPFQSDGVGYRVGKGSLVTVGTQDIITYLVK